MDVQTMIAENLNRIGADGLCCPGCGCSIDDLAPCGSFRSDCCAAKLAIATQSGDDYEVGDEIYVEFIPEME